MIEKNFANIEVKYDLDDIDEELRAFIVVVNQIDGVKTLSCCCGHGKDKCRVYIAFKDVKTINHFIFTFLNPFYNWSFRMENNIVRDQDYLTVCLESPTIDYMLNREQINELTLKILNQTELA